MVKKNTVYSIGIDIGGTKMAAVLFDGEKVLADYSLATPRDNLEHMLVMIKALVEPLEETAKQKQARINGIGLGAAGVIDHKERKILDSPNIEYLNGIRLGEEISKMMDLPVYMDNDANCFLRAEISFGAAGKFDNVYGIIIGTGIGGAWWHNGEIYRAVNGGSGEPGEMIVDFAEGVKLEEAYHKLTQNNPAALAEEAYRGDDLAQKTYEEIGKLLGSSFANIVNILAPEAIILGGGAMASSDLFLPAAKKIMRANTASLEVRKKIKVLKSKIGDNSGSLGAALLVK